GLIRGLLRTGEHQSWAEWIAALVVEPSRLMSLDPDARDRTVRGALRVFPAEWQQAAPAALLVDAVDSIDAFSLSLIMELWQERGDSPLLVAMTGRVSPTNLPTGAQVVSLRPLSTLASRKLVALALGDRAPEPEVCSQLIERAGGSPLFLTLMLHSAR